MEYINGIYLGACRANHPNHIIMYQDINGKRDIDGIISELTYEKIAYVLCRGGWPNALKLPEDKNL
jgi:hypothetical protein